MTLNSSIKEIITLTPSIAIASFMLLSLTLWFAFCGIIERVEMRKWRNMNTQGKNSLKGRLVRVGDNSDSDRVEIRLTGLDKGNDEDLYLAIRNAGRGRRLDELSTLTPPAGSPMTIAAARWAARQQECHPERVTYKDGAIIIETRCKDYIDNESAEWETLIAILNEVILEVVRERPPQSGPFQKKPIQSPKEVAVRRRLATYAQK